MPGDVISLTKGGGGGGGSQTAEKENKKQDRINKKKDKNQSEEKAKDAGVLASCEPDEGLDIVPTVIVAQCDDLEFDEIPMVKLVMLVLLLLLRVKCRVLEVVWIS